MKVPLVIFISTIFFPSNAQINYVPLIVPTLNLSHYSQLFNSTNRTQWNQPILNQTSWNRTELTHPSLNRTSWTVSALNRTHPHVNYTSHGDLIVGQIGYLDRLLFHEVHLKTRRWWSGREKIIEYPRDLPGGHIRHEIIGAIRIYNRFYDGLHSKAEIVAGGVGSRYVKIKLSSSWGRGFEYLVQIYGH